MLGAIVGDIVGSRFEGSNLKSKEFKLFTDECVPTDDSNMTLAVAKALVQVRGDWGSGNWSNLSGYTVSSMKYFGKRYPYGYGARFWNWINSDESAPYESWGNGSAMRVSPCAWAARSLEEALMLSDIVTGVTHNHAEGMKGARAITAAIWLARQGEGKQAIRDHIREHYYPLDFELDDIRDEYEFNVSCQGSVPQAIEAFLESTSFEDAIRNAVSIGGDSDTIAAMAGSIAEAYYGIPDDIRITAESFLDGYQINILTAFETAYRNQDEETDEAEDFDIGEIELSGIREQFERKPETDRYKDICRIMFNRCRATGSCNEALCPHCGLKAECDRLHTI